MASLITIIIYYLFYNYLNTIFFSFFIILILFYSFYFLNKTLNQSFSSSDPKEIVVDELIGQSIPLLICGNNFFLIILSFLLFRLFDISKPWPASYFDLKIKNIKINNIDINIIAQQPNLKKYKKIISNN